MSMCAVQHLSHWTTREVPSVHFLNHPSLWYFCSSSPNRLTQLHIGVYGLSLHHESHRGRSYVSFLHCQQSDHFKPKTICLKLWWLSGKESACQCRRRGFNFWSGKIPWRRKQQPTLVFLPGESHGAWQAKVYGVARVGHDWVTKYTPHMFLLCLLSVEFLS